METLAGPARTTAVTLRDGWIVELRRADVNDEGAVLELLRSLSVHSRAMRFATSAVHLPSAARAAVEHPGVIAFAPDRRCVGHTWYVRTTERRAEVAVVVADRYQRRGLGTILLRQLAEIAASCGIDVLEAYVLFENVRMTDLLRDCGIPLRTRDDGGGLRFELDIAQEGASLGDHHRRPVGTEHDVLNRAAVESDPECEIWTPGTDVHLD